MSSSSLKVLLLAAALTPCAAGARQLRVCADPNNLPFSNEKQEGFENKLVDLIAHDLGATVAYTWHAQRRGFLRETLKSGACDLVPGLPSRFEGVRTTAPYYRSTYMFVTRQEGPAVGSFDDAILRDHRVGVQLVGDDGWNTPPAHALARRGIIANVRGFTLYGDYRDPNPPARIVDAVAAGEIDVAVVWGPLAGYFAAREPEPLRVAPVQPSSDGPMLPMAWDISMAVRSDDGALLGEVGRVLERRRAEVDAILAAYDVPRADESRRSAGAMP